MYSGTIITNAFSYSLPDTKDPIVMMDSNGLLQYQANTIPRLQINLKDIQGGPLESMISIRSDNGLLIPGELRTDQTTVGNQTNLNWTKFIRKNNFYITTTG
ncbi:hypothetical protein KBA84_00895 [Patescibacteria group bacterium]|jgi:hypothetical protein|nr:hypothetical protein [Patescibacteria group bacterium]